MKNLNQWLQQRLEELIAEGYSPEEAIEIINSGSTGTSSLNVSGMASPGMVQRLTGKFKGLGGKSAGNLKDLFSTANAARKSMINTPIIGKHGSISNIANIGGGIYHGANAIKGLVEGQEATSDANELARQIRNEVNTNPMHGMYLDASDERILNNLKRGVMPEENGSFMEGVFSNIPRILLNTGLGLLTGNPIGAAIQGIGTTINSGIEGANQGKQNSISQLQGLYNKLLTAKDEYNSMRRPRGLRQAGLQSRYYNQYY